MGHINDAFQFVAPAYLVTFAVFGALAVLTARRLLTWSRRARDEDAARAAEQGGHAQPTE